MSSFHGVGRYAPAKRYLLVLWGHAYGLGFGRDHKDSLTLRELSKALKPFRRLDLLGANACAMSYAEAAFELQESAKYLVASQITMPMAGWPYEEILKEITRKPDITGENLGRAVIRHFMKSLEGKHVSLTLLDLAGR